MPKIISFDFNPQDKEFIRQLALRIETMGIETAPQDCGDRFYFFNEMDLNGFVGEILEKFPTGLPQDASKKEIDQPDEVHEFEVDDLGVLASMIKTF